MLLYWHMNLTWFSDSSYLVVKFELLWLRAFAPAAGKPYYYFAFFKKIQSSLSEALLEVCLSLCDALRSFLCQFEVMDPSEFLQLASVCLNKMSDSFKLRYRSFASCNGCG